MKATDRETLKFIKTHKRERGIAPTLRAMADNVGYRAESAIYPVLERLVAAGLIERDKGYTQHIRIIKRKRL